MAKPWQTIDQQRTDHGIMVLLKRGEEDFLIKLDNSILMNSQLNLSEIMLAESTCELLENIRSPSVLIGGLGMGCTLRAALDALPEDARIVVAEINPVVVAWSRGPLRELTAAAVDDPRVRMEVTDVSQLIAAASRSSTTYDAIILDLYQGTHEANREPLQHPIYGYRALERAKSALREDGVLAVWTEEPDLRFEKRLQSVGFRSVGRRRAKRGPRHVVYLARL